MPAPFEVSNADRDPDRIADALEKGARARAILGFGVADDLDRRRDAVLRQAESELRSGTLTPERALMHIACCNALNRYKQELLDEIQRAQRAMDKLHAEVSEEPTDG